MKRSLTYVVTYEDFYFFIKTPKSSNNETKKKI